MGRRSKKTKERIERGNYQTAQRRTRQALSVAGETANNLFVQSAEQRTEGRNGAIAKKAKRKESN